jgi:hypothetical protein
VGNVDLADGYWSEFARLTGNRQERLAAESSMSSTAVVDDRVGIGADGIVDLLTLLADRAPDPQDDSLAYLGAGPVEELVIHHAARFIEEIDTAARTNERFRYALRCAWFDDSVDPSLARRLRRFGDCP